MKKTGLNLQPNYRCLFIMTAVAAVLFAMLRIVLTPIAFEQPTPYALALGATLLLVVVVLGYGALQKQPLCATSGRATRPAVAVAIVTGATFVIFSFASAFSWFTERKMPFPEKPIVGTADVALLYVYLIAGLLSGVLFACLAIHWLHENKTTRGIAPLLALSPVLWSWARVIRYITSYVSTTGLFRNLYDLAMIVFEMLFFVLFARYLARVEETGSRFFFGVSVCTGLLCTISGISQIVFFLLQDQRSFDTCMLVAAPDFAIAWFAFAMAFAQAFGNPCEEEPIEAEEEEEESSAEDDEDYDPEDGVGAEFLLSDEWFVVPDVEEEDD